MKSERGFSLLEIAVVLAIISAMFAIVLPRIFDKRVDTRKIFRDFTVAGKDIKSKAKMDGSTYRLAFDLSEKNPEWWVEKSTKVVMLDKAKIEEANQNAVRNNGKPEEGAPPPDFQMDASIFKKKQRLPDGFRFKQVESGSADVIYSEGIGYIHFFPQGLIETAALQIEGPKKNIWTLVYNPLTGHLDIIPEAKLLKDLSR